MSRTNRIFGAPYVDLDDVTVKHYCGSDVNDDDATITVSPMECHIEGSLGGVEFRFDLDPYDVADLVRMPSVESIVIFLEDLGLERVA